MFALNDLTTLFKLSSPKCHEFYSCNLFTMTRARFELATDGLKVRYSTSWVIESKSGSDLVFTDIPSMTMVILPLMWWISTSLPCWLLYVKRLSYRRPTVMSHLIHLSPGFKTKRLRFLAWYVHQIARQTYSPKSCTGKLARRKANPRRDYMHYHYRS